MGSIVKNSRLVGAMGGSSRITELEDVALSTPITGQYCGIIVTDGIPEVVNVAAPEGVNTFRDLTDVAIDSETLSAGQVPFFTQDGDDIGLANRKITLTDLAACSVQDPVNGQIAGFVTNEGEVVLANIDFPGIAVTGTPEINDRPVYDGEAWSLESALPTPGQIKYDVAEGANGVIQLSVSMLDPTEIVDGFEMCHSDVDGTSPDGLASVFEKGENGAKFLIPVNEPQNVWVRACIGNKRGAWQGYGELPSGETEMENTLNDTTFTDGTRGADYEETQIAFGSANVKYGFYSNPPTTLFDVGGYGRWDVTVSKATSAMRHSVMGGSYKCRVMDRNIDSAWRKQIGFTFLMRSNILSDPNDSFYALTFSGDGAYTGGSYQHYARLYYVVNQTFTLIATSGNLSTYGTYGNLYGGWGRYFDVIVERKGSTFYVKQFNGNVIWSYTDTQITPDDSRVYCGFVQREDGQIVEDTLLVQKRNYMGALTSIDPGTFADYIKHGSVLDGAWPLNTFVQQACGNTGADFCKVRFDNNLDLVAQRSRPYGTLVETTKIAELINDATTFTVKTSGGDFTTIQAAWDYCATKNLGANVIIAVDAGTWTEQLTFYNAPYGRRITIQGDTRTAAGQVFVATGSITKSGNDCTITLTETPPSDFTSSDYITICGAFTSAGNVGRFHIVSINTGAKTVTYTNASGVAEANLVGYAVFCPNRIITSSAAGAVITNYNALTMTGFTIKGTGSSTFGIYNAGREASFTIDKTHFYGLLGTACYVENGVVICSSAKNSFIKSTGNGVQTGWGGLVFASSTLSANNSAAGFAIGWGTRANLYAALAVKNADGFSANNSSVIYADGGTAKYNSGTAWYAATLSYIYAPNTTANTSNNGTARSPSTTDTAGNLGSYITYS